MDGPLKELAKLEKLAAGGSIGKGKAPAIDQSLDALLEALLAAKQQFLDGTGSQATLLSLAKAIEDKKKEIDDRQKEVYNALAKVGKALDKVGRTASPSCDWILTYSRNSPIHYRILMTLCSHLLKQNLRLSVRSPYTSFGQGSLTPQRLSLV